MVLCYEVERAFDSGVLNTKFRFNFLILPGMVALLPPPLHADKLLVAGDIEQGVGRQVGDDPCILPLIREAVGASQ